MAVRDAPWQEHVASADHSAVPQVIFSEPEVATVGLTAAAADEAGHTTRVVDADMAAVPGANIHADGYTGQARMVVDEKRKVLLRATFAGQDVSELRAGSDDRRRRLRCPWTGFGSWSLASLTTVRPRQARSGRST